MERLFNIVFEQQGHVVPFYIEIKKTSKWLVEFSGEYFFTFIRQYIAFHSGNPEYLEHHYNYNKLIEIAEKEELDYLTTHIEEFGRMALIYCKA
jgi:hypothetical protein